jgi:tetratricopeptide (TPR) repeat protein
MEPVRSPELATPLVQPARPRAAGLARLNDRWGLPVTSAHPEALAALDACVWSLLAHRADSTSHLEAALSADPQLALGHLLKGFALRLLARRERMPQVDRALRDAESAVALRGQTLREALLLESLRQWQRGHVGLALANLAEAAASHPSCLLSMKLHHVVCFMHGEQSAMRTSLERSLRVLDPSAEGYGFVLGCYAFALEESGEHTAAEQAAREALERGASDAWAYHALLHVLYRQGRHREALELFATSREAFAGGNNFVAHLAWHHALVALEQSAFDQALALYDDQIAPPLGPDYRDLANCVSLLVRLERAGVEVGNRFETLADLAETRIGDHSLAFADAHYLLALLRAGRLDAARRFLASLREQLPSRSDEAAQVFTRVGVPLMESMVVLAQGNAGLDARAARSWTAELSRLGGSQVQRELFGGVLFGGEP